MIKFVRIKAITKKEFIQIKRDPLSLAMAFLLPAVLLFIYGYAVTFDVDRITTVIHDADKSSVSRELINQFTQSGYFTAVSYVDRHDDLDGFLDRGDAKVAIAIPVNFSKLVRAGRNSSIEVIIDGSNSNTATIAQGYVSAVAERYSQRIGKGPFTPLIDSRSRVWYNTELKSRNFIIPGLIAVIMAVIVALLTSLTVAKEWDRGTMEQLISTPIKPFELIIGKLIPYFVIGFTDTVLAVLMSTMLFEVPLRGSVTLLLALSSIFLVGGLEHGHSYFSGSKEPDDRLSDGNAHHLSPRFPPFGLHLQHIKHARTPAGRHIPDPGPLFCHDPERYLSKRHPPGVSHSGSGPAHGLCHGRLFPGCKEIP